MQSSVSVRVSQWEREGFGRSLPAGTQPELVCVRGGGKKPYLLGNAGLSMGGDEHRRQYHGHDCEKQKPAVNTDALR